MIPTKPLNEVTDKEWGAMGELDRCKYFVCQYRDELSLKDAKNVQEMVQAYSEAKNGG